MPHALGVPLAVFAVTLSLGAAAVLKAQVRETRANPATLSIAVGAEGSTPQTVPETLFGSFLEPIGNSINQGLSAEALVNGSLEEGLWNEANLSRQIAQQPELAASSNDTGLPFPWQPLHPADGRRYELHHGAAANSWQSVEIMGLRGSQVGLLQRVYLPVQRTLSYRASLYARHLEGSSKITLLLKKHGTQTVLARATVQATGERWTKYSAVLVLPQKEVQPAEAFDFAVAVEPEERIDVDELSLMPDDAVDGLDPEVLAYVQAMHSSILRLGGNFSSEYHWRAGTGPADQRITEQNIAWGIPEYNTFGTDEFLALCERVHAMPQIDLNMGSGTPQEAADWVRYIQARYHGKIYYELGNELYGRWQVGHIGAEEIGPRTLAFSQAVRAVAPDAVLIATGAVPQDFTQWNAALYNDPPGTFNDVSTHFIRITNQVKLPDASPDFIAAAAYALPVELGRDFDRMQAQLDATPALSRTVHFAMDEWLFNSRAQGYRVFTNQSPSSKNEGGGLMVAGVFHTLLRHSRTVPISEITGLMEFAGIWKEQEQVYATPAYYVFGLYRRIAGDTVLPVRTDSGLYDVQGGVEDFTDIESVPYVDVVATRSPDGRHLTLFCINRDLVHDVPVRIDTGAFRPAAQAHVEQLRSASRFDTNDGMHPKNVVPQASVLQVKAPGPILYTLPRESVTMIRLDAQ